MCTVRQNVALAVRDPQSLITTPHCGFSGPEWRRAAYGYARDVRARLLADTVFNISKRKRKLNIRHLHQANDLRVDFDVAEWGEDHETRLVNSPARSKQALSDSISKYNSLPFASDPAV